MIRSCEGRRRGGVVWKACLAFSLSLLSSALLAQASDSSRADPLREGPPVELASGTFEIDARIEAGRRVKAADALTVLGPELFGDSVGPSNGSLGFSVTDIDLPGTGSLPVRLTRTYSAGVIEGPTAPGQIGEWDLDLPHLSGIFGRDSGWRVVGNDPFRRCSAGTSEAPPWSTDGPTFGSLEYHRGNSVYVPGYGSSLLLKRGPGNTAAPADGQTYPWVARANWQFRCLTNLQNGQGEGFVGISPEGVSYRFDWVATRRYSTIQRPPIPDVGTPQFQRQVVRIYATRVWDRFGNWVEYDFAPNSDQVTAIRAKDGRQITLRYNASTGTLSEAQVEDRVWKYEYSQSRRLRRVELPDGSDWEISTTPHVLVYQRQSGGLTCALPTLDPAITARITSFKHPSGARAEFEVAPVRFARNAVPREMRCRVDLEQGELNGGVATQHDAYALRRKTIYGPATPTHETRYDYPPADTSASTRRVTVTQPDASRELLTFSTVFDVSEGKLLEKVVLNASGQELTRESYTYQTDPTGMPYPYLLGYGVSTEFTDEFGDARVVPMKSRTLQMQGVAFNWRADAFNQWGEPIEVTRSSSLGYSKRESMAYRDYPAIWLINQQYNRLDVDPTTLSITPEEVLFRLAATGQVYGINRFGLRDYMRWYYPDGTLQSAIFTGGGNVQLQDYYRGVPRSIVHSADNSQVSATVDAHGRVRSVTDALANTTNYEYDAQGRLTQTRFPTGDSTSWSNQDTAYQIRTVAEYGIPAGLWKRTQTRGRTEHVTWFDALWRPILTRERDINLPSSARFVRTAYDPKGNLSFESYPASLADGVAYTTLTQGVTRSYDALNRVTQERRSSELGDLISSTDYLSGFQVRNTNARSFQTTTSFMVYDEPSYDWPMQITSPEGQSTRFGRDRWGKPTWIRRSGPYNGLEQSSMRYFVYDANQRLCKRIDSESGATVMDYDSANRLAWTADGQSLLSTSSCDRESVAANERVLRSYNTKDELTAINYPDSADDVAFAYYLDGKLQTANVGPVGSQISRSYSYNKRGLPTQEQLLVDGQSFTLGYRYVSEGAVSELGYPDGSWEALSPDGLGRPTRMGQFASNVSWHRFGPLASFTYGNGASFSQQLNARGLPSERSDSWFGSPRLRDSYAWDGNGNLGSISDLVGDPSQFRSASRWLTYDGLDRLTVADSPLQTTTRSQWGYSWGKATYAYDGLDNLRRHTMGGVIDFAYSYGSQGHLNSITQPSGVSVSSYTHNVRGQMTRRVFNGEGFNLSWDSAHRVTQTWNDASTKVESYRYDAHGHRARTVRGGETLYQVYSQAGDLMWERSSTGTTRKYARLGGRLIGEIENGVRRAIHTDALGSVRQKTDQFGTVLLDDVRAPYGSTLLGGSYRNGPAFTGHMEDGATGLTYMKARYYDPVAMRFISPDPVYVDLSTGGNFNRYWYANNNPYTYVDPDGRIAGLASKVIKVIVKGGDVAGTAAGAIEDAGVLFGSDATAGQRLGAAVSLASEVFSPVSGRDVKAGYKAITGASDDASGAARAGVRGSCPSCGGRTSTGESAIARDHDMSRGEVGDAIHQAKDGGADTGDLGKKNGDVEVCRDCGEIFPKTPGNGLGDSIGNILDPIERK